MAVFTSTSLRKKINIPSACSSSSLSKASTKTQQHRGKQSHPTHGWQHTRSCGASCTESNNGSTFSSSSSSSSSSHKAFRWVLETLMSKRRRKESGKAAPSSNSAGESQDGIIIEIPKGSFSQWKHQGPNVNQMKKEKKKETHQVGADDEGSAGGSCKKKKGRDNAHQDMDLVIWCPYMECVFGLLLCLFSFHPNSSGLLPSVLLLTLWWYMAAQLRSHQLQHYPTLLTSPQKNPLHSSSSDSSALEFIIPYQNFPDFHPNPADSD